MPLRQASWVAFYWATAAVALAGFNLFWYPPGRRIAEVFGPVLAVIPFTTEDEVVAAANSTIYGLAATIWTNDIKRAHRVANALRAGTIGINGFMVMPNTPFGGYKTSGLGREGGWPAIEAFTELKTVMVDLS